MFVLVTCVNVSGFTHTYTQSLPLLSLRTVGAWYNLDNFNFSYFLELSLEVAWTNTLILNNWNYYWNVQLTSLQEQAIPCSILINYFTHEENSRSANSTSRRSVIFTLLGWPCITPNISITFDETLLHNQHFLPIHLLGQFMR